jgi:curved DNA-binding protein CbpA
MEAATFTDYYEILEISPNANSETIDRIFRFLAQRYHPDNHDTGNRLRFDEILQAHSALKDPVKRAQYDIQHTSRASAGNGLPRGAVEILASVIGNARQLRGLNARS